MRTRSPLRPSSPSVRIRAGVAIGLAVLAVAACGPAKDAGRRPEPVDQGRQAYEHACASCHGPSGRGDGPVAGALRGPVPDLTTLATRHGGKFPRDYVVDVIAGDRQVRAHGTREMPVWGRRFEPAPGVAAAIVHTRRRLELLATYLESIQRPE